MGKPETYTLKKGRTSVCDPLHESAVESTTRVEDGWEVRVLLFSGGFCEIRACNSKDKSLFVVLWEGDLEHFSQK